MNKLFIILVSAVVLFSIGCDKEEKDLGSALMLFMVGQSGGNCIVTTRVYSYSNPAAPTTGTPGYAVKATMLPAGACKDQNVYYTDVTAATNAANAEMQAMVASFTAAGAACNAEVTTYTNRITAQNVHLVNDTVRAVVASPRCIQMTNAGYRGTDFYLPYKKLILCLTQQEVDSYQRSLMSTGGPSRAYKTIGDVRTDVSFSDEFTRVKYMLTERMGANGFTQAQIDNSTLLDGDMGAAYETANGQAFNYALSIADYACANAILYNDASLKAQAARQYGMLLSTQLTNITQADVTAVTKPLAAQSVACCYGAATATIESIAGIESIYRVNYGAVGVNGSGTGVLGALNSCAKYCAGSTVPAAF